MCAISFYKPKINTGNLGDKNFSKASFHKDGLLLIAIWRTAAFSSDFNIVWIKTKIISLGKGVLACFFVNCERTLL
jgi:hypothetical protein